MASRRQFDVEADGVDIQSLWRALTKDKIKVLQKAAAGLVSEAKILEGNETVLNSLLYVSFGPGELSSALLIADQSAAHSSAPGLEPFTERIVEFDEKKHVLTFLGVEGGYMNLGFTHYLVTFKLDDFGGGKTMVNASVTYDLKENLDESQLLDGFLKLLRYYLDSVINYLQQKHED
ncbi:hypothetical protein KSP39_PZI009289 [Platanthera zijinensis]|uniref:Bet v I/Major latex protein domain-containing protein n=1 Tax=Platanthera zijinensis TaxID=2320716 RepID=A0AAP0G7T8_9ASPA